MLDCQWCGACCVNPSENQIAGDVDYVLLERGDNLWGHPSLLATHTRASPRGERFMKLDSAGRCVALEGRVGKRVGCGIYEHRPSGCRTMEIGSLECLRRRRQAGL